MGGTAGGKPVVAYRAAERVASHSHVETYAALKLGVDNWRWAGVPFYLRTGKALARRTTQIVVEFKNAPLMLFAQGEGPVPPGPNRLILDIQPRQRITVHFRGKTPGTGMHTQRVEMDFDYSAFGELPRATGYETLLYDAMIGDNTLFHRTDMVEAAWKIAMPILDAWTAHPLTDFPNYPAGSEGPASADELIGRRWASLVDTRVNESSMKDLASKPDIKLLLADVDGTLVDSKKRITPRACRAISRLREAGIGFAVTSGRPPRGMKMIADAVDLTAPIAAFNGGTLVAPDTFAVIESFTLERETAERVIAALGKHGLDAWVYAGLDWYLRDLSAAHREKEEHTVQFPPTVVTDFSAALARGVSKIVGVSDDLDLVARTEKAIQEEFAGAMSTKQSNPEREHDAAAPASPSVSAARSQPYYLDVTHPMANKGSGGGHAGENQGITATQIATIGDMPNDVLMFVKSGFSIAMGQANEMGEKLR